MEERKTRVFFGVETTELPRLKGNAAFGWEVWGVVGGGAQKRKTRPLPLPPPPKEKQEKGIAFTTYS